MLLHLSHVTKTSWLSLGQQMSCTTRLRSLCLSPWHLLSARRSTSMSMPLTWFCTLECLRKYMKLRHKRCHPDPYVIAVSNTPNYWLIGILLHLLKSRLPSVEQVGSAGGPCAPPRMLRWREVQWCDKNLRTSVNKCVTMRDNAWRCAIANKIHSIEILLFRNLYVINSLRLTAC